MQILYDFVAVEAPHWKLLAIGVGVTSQVSLNISNKMKSPTNVPWKKTGCQNARIYLMRSHGCWSKPTATHIRTSRELDESSFTFIYHIAMFTILQF